VQTRGSESDVEGGRSHPLWFVRRRYGAIDFEYVIRGILLFHRTWQREEEVDGRERGRAVERGGSTSTAIDLRSPSVRGMAVVRGRSDSFSLSLFFLHYHYRHRPGSWRVIEYFFAMCDWFVVTVAGRMDEGGGESREGGQRWRQRRRWRW